MCVEGDGGSIQRESLYLSRYNQSPRAALVHAALFRRSDDELCTSAHLLAAAQRCTKRKFHSQVCHLSILTTENLEPVDLIHALIGGCMHSMHASVCTQFAGRGRAGRAMV